MPRAQGDLFNFVRDQLTIGKRSFNAPALGAEVALALTQRVDALVGFDWTRASVASEYRHFIGTDGLPINQSTELSQANLSGGIRVALTPRGRSISRYTWIPRTVTPYVGAGAGLMYYDFLQTGEFVDSSDSSIFPDAFQSSGWTPSAHVLAGADIVLWRNLRLELDARYVWAHATLGPDFKGFDGIDLSGLRWSTGLSIAY